jgi:hypothetical protein
MNADLNSVGQAFQSELNSFLLVFTVPVEDGVCHSFAHCHVDSESRFLAETRATYEFGDSGGGGFNGLDAARETEFVRLYSHNDQAWPLQKQLREDPGCFLKLQSYPEVRGFNTLTSRLSRIFGFWWRDNCMEMELRKSHRSRRRLMDSLIDIRRWIG